MIDRTTRARRAFGGSSAFVSPASMSVSGWWRAPYTAGASWSGTASGGSSGSRNLANGAGVTTVALNSLDAARFNGSSDYLLDTVNTLDAYLGASYTAIVLCRQIAALSAPSASPFNDQQIINDSSSNFGLAVNSSGARAYNYDGVSYKDTSTTGYVAFSTNTWTMLTATNNGSALKLNKNAGTDVSIASASGFSFGSISLRVGRNFAGAVYNQMDIAEILLFNSALTGAQQSNIKSYFNTRYGLSL